MMSDTSANDQGIKTVKKYHGVSVLFYIMFTRRGEGVYVWLGFIYPLIFPVGRIFSSMRMTKRWHLLCHGNRRDSNSVPVTVIDLTPLHDTIFHSPFAQHAVVHHLGLATAALQDQVTYSLIHSQQL